MTKRLFNLKHLTAGIACTTFLLATTVISLPTTVTAQEISQTQENSSENQEEELGIAELSLATLLGTDEQRQEAIDKLVARRGNKDIIPTLVFFMRISGDYKGIAQALTDLTGTEIKTWRDAMLWQEEHPEIVPHESYREIKLRFFYNLDKNFQQFFDPEFTARNKMKIRLEEITWGGVQVDGIPSLDNPKLIDAAVADYLLDDDLVFGVEINGDVRAYPLRIMGWHEMFNEVIGGVPVALAYCTLCGSGILFETSVEGYEKPFIFGSSGFLYRSNKLMFDRATNSLWNQFTGKPVAGPLVDSGIELKIRPVSITSWKNWKDQHPHTKVLSLSTGYFRDYGSGVVYKEYFSSPDLMFPTIVRDETQLKRKDYVFGVREFGAAKAWPVNAFTDKKVINDKVGTTDVVLIGDAKTRTVRAYQSSGLTFSQGSRLTTLSGPGGEWKLTEDFLLGPNDEKLPRVPGHVAYWFAWDGYLGVSSELYSD